MLYFVTFSKHVKLSLFNFFELLFFQNVSGKSYSYVEKQSFDKFFEDFKLKDTPSWNQTNWKLLFEKWDYCEVSFFLKSFLKVTQTLFSILSFFFRSIWLIALNHFFFPKFLHLFFNSLWWCFCCLEIVQDVLLWCMSFQKAYTQGFEAWQACFRQKSPSIGTKATDQRLRAEMHNPPSVAFCSRKAKISFAGQNSLLPKNRSNGPNMLIFFPEIA